MRQFGLIDPVNFMKDNTIQLPILILAVLTVAAE
jgi:hypothetical protein